MIKHAFLVIAAFLFFSGCSKSNLNTCNCDDPLEDLSWLKEIKNNLTACTCEVSILQGTFSGQTVFYTTMTDPLCDAVFSVVLRDCDGSVVRSYNYDEYNMYVGEVTGIKVLYRCPR